MDTKANRLKNLRRLIDERFEGNKGRFADAIGRPRPNIYRLLSENAEDRRAIGEDLARAIETKLGLPGGWLDQADVVGNIVELNFAPDPLAALNEKDRALIQLFHGLTEGQQAEFFKAVQAQERANREILEQLAGKGKK